MVEMSHRDHALRLGGLVLQVSGTLVSAVEDMDLYEAA